MRLHISTYFHALCLAFMTALLAACGGGGSSDAGASGASGAAVSVSGPARAVANTLYSYEATVSNAVATAFSWAWGDGSASTAGNPAAKVWRKPGTFVSSLSGTVAGSVLTGTQSVVVTGQPVAGGAYHSCALRNNGGVACWGNGGEGQLGYGDTYNSITPIFVSGMTDAVGISAGTFHSCALKANGTVGCWGGNGYGQLGNGTLTSSSTTVIVSGLTDAVAVSVGYSHTCALKANGIVNCWGQGYTGLQTVSGLADVVALSAGFGYTCALKSTGGVLCWGINTAGQLGDGTLVDKATPVAVLGLSDAVAIHTSAYSLSFSSSFSCALRANGKVVCWGSNKYGQLGDGNTVAAQPTPVAVSVLDGVKSISTGGLHACAVKNNGAVACWGYNAYGQLGDQTSANKSMPVDVPNVTGVAALLAGTAHTCALKTDGSMACWGYNGFGALGDGTVVSKSQATPVEGGAQFWK